MGLFDDRIAVVTGAANGLGEATALRLAAEGATLALLDREGPALAAVCDRIAAEGGRARGVVVDVLDRAAVADAFAEIAGHLGPVDVLVNNAGGSARERNREFWCSDPEVWDYVIDLNLKSAMFCARQVVPGMRDRGRGKIVNLGSGSYNAGDADIADYVAAKGGVVGFTRSLARELAPFGVNVNAVSPSTIMTRAAERAPEVMARALANVPMRRAGRPEDIANAIAFLASAQADYITGQVLVVDGGRTFN